MTDAAILPQPPAAPAPVEDHREWLAARIGGQFFLDTAMAVSDVFHGDLINGLILLTIMRQNLAEVPGATLDDDIDRARNGVRAVVQRRAASAYGVAKAMGLNYETTRRHIKALVDGGYCVRCPDGFIANVDILDRTEIARTLRRIVQNMRRLTAQVRRAGLMDL